MTIKIMLDSNIYDQIAYDSDFLSKINQSISYGKIVILITHIQIDEISRIDDIEKKKYLLNLTFNFKKIETTSSVWGVSRWVQSRWTANPKQFNELTNNNSKHNEDALIAQTAEHHADIFVTNEKKKLPARSRRAGLTIKILSGTEFKDLLENI